MSTARSLLLSCLALAAVSAGVAAAGISGGLWELLLWEERIPAVLMRMLPSAVGVSAVVAGVAFAMRRLRARRARWLSHGPWISAGLVLVTSLVLLGPIGGFHHMFRFGVLGYMIVDCDSPPEDLPVPFGRCGIRGSVLLLVLTTVVWLALVLGVTLLLRRQSALRADTGAEDDPDSRGEERGAPPAP